ncbi:MAG TPA: hypothetical protein VIC26_05875 [Marinagarivorans sp.]
MGKTLDIASTFDRQSAPLCFVRNDLARNDLVHNDLTQTALPEFVGDADHNARVITLESSAHPEASASAQSFCKPKARNLEASSALAENLLDAFSAQ